MDQEKVGFFGMDVFSQNLHTLKSWPAKKGDIK